MITNTLCLDAYCNGIKVCIECEYLWCRCNPNYVSDTWYPKVDE